MFDIIIDKLGIFMVILIIIIIDEIDVVLKVIIFILMFGFIVDYIDEFIKNL